MSSLLVEQFLGDGYPMEQKITRDLNERSRIAVIAPYIYMHNAPSGSFTFEIKKIDNTVVYSKTFTSSDIKTLLNTTFDYAHVFIPFVPDEPVYIEKGQFKLVLSSSGYFYNRSSFLGWIRQHENLNNEIDYTPSNDAENPLAYRLKAYKEGIL
jgi:hypothetical protein